ncbi:MAG: chorismate mutase [Acidaminococcus sp.]|jgi:chorismate mutase|nr:chorismate mutase [Acidaminococcus sp.]MCI2099564.1 chorismate mutase [Acidaminococcus sp.]MCI2113649.1 chorismate mutase [Acidaminococcus sp.]MCI2115732.1 chorismate mutase [Acidaminococcus sp.]
MMNLEEARKKIDAIDPQLKKLIMERMDCSLEVAKAKQAKGETTIYRADREKAILDRLSEGVPEDRLAEYLAVVKKIMETSRMYQYGLLFDWNPGLFDELAEGIDVTPGGYRVKVRLTRPNQPNAMSSILSMVGDYGYNMQYMELLSFNNNERTVTFDLTILGDLSETHMKKLMFQLSRESQEFKILANERKEGSEA